MSYGGDYTFMYFTTTPGSVPLNDTPTSSTSPFVDIVKVSGLDSVPLRVTERQREGMDGGFVDAMYEGIRTIVLEGFIYNVTEAYLDLLKANYAPTSYPQDFLFIAPGMGQRSLACKSYGLKYDWEAQRRYGVMPVQFQLVAEDPTIRGLSVPGSTLLIGPSSGFGFPIAFPLGFGGTTSASGSMIIDNIGNKPGDCIFTIYGPVTNPAIVHDTSGNRLTFTIVLASTDTLTIDLRNKTVILNGTANRRGTLVSSSRWFMMAVGSNTIRFLGTSGAGFPRLESIFWPAYR